LDSPLSLPDFVKQLNALTKGLLYPSESDFPIEVLTKGFSSKMPPLKGIQVRTLDRVIPSFLRNVDPDDQQTGNVERATLAAKWQALYKFIKVNTSVTAWHYPVKGKKYTHELFALLLHPQGTAALRIKLVNLI
jgi:Nuclease A inhibitor-like protein